MAGKIGDEHMHPSNPDSIADLAESCGSGKKIAGADP